jgi:hypothetical protein
MTRKHNITQKNNVFLNEKELVILKKAIEKAEKKKSDFVGSPNVKTMINIVETFLIENQFVCYGGTAINNILPESVQFYDKASEIPDYDFFTPNAIEDAKKLADIYYKAGFDEVEAKAGVHAGTYKVFVNFIPIADITQLDSQIFKALKKNAISINGINYAPPNFLRMSAYLELSRPDGDVSRWEKILRRLALLNKYHPIDVKNCNISHFIRKFEDPNINLQSIYNIVKNSIIQQGLVFFGGFAIYSYGKYIAPKDRKLLLKYPDFDILANDPEKAASIIMTQLEKAKISDVSINKKQGVGEIISQHYEVKVGDETVVFIYKPLACHSYNVITINNKPVKIATIDTMLSFYLAFLYADREYYDSHRILCIADYLFKVQSRNRLQQKGVLKRFSINCYGKQQTLENIRAEKAFRFRELKDKKCSKEYEKYFLRYFPQTKNICKSKKNKSKKNTKKNKSKKNKSKKNKK